MASIGELTARLGLDTTQFNANARAASGRIQTLSRDMRTGVNRAGKYAIAIGGVGIAIGAHIVKSAGDAAREIKTMSALSNVSAEAFQKQAYAAKTVGIQSDKLGDIYKDVQDRVGDFITNGGGPLQDFFKHIAPQVGVTAKQFKNLSGPQALQLYVDSLEKANVSQATMTNYLESLSGDSAKLAPLLANGGKKMQELGDKAQRTGAILSSFQIEQLSQTANDIDGLESSMSVAANTALLSLSPAIKAVSQTLTDEFSSALSDSEGDVVDWGSTIGTVITTTLDGVDVGLRGVANLFESAGTTIAAGTAQMVAFINGDFKRGMAIGGMWKKDQEKIWSDLAHSKDYTKYRDKLAKINKELQTRKDNQPAPAGGDNPVTVTHDNLSMSGPAGLDNPPKKKTNPVDTVSTPAPYSPVVDTSPLTAAQNTLKSLKSQAGDMPKVKFDVDDRSLDDAASYIGALKKSNIDLGKVGLNASSLDDLQKQLKQVAETRVSLQINDQQATKAESALVSLSDHADVEAKVNVDASDIQWAQGLIGQLQAVHFDPKKIDIDSSQAQRALSILRGAKKITPKVDDSQIQGLMQRVIALKKALATVKQPEGMQNSLQQNKQRQQEQQARQQMLQKRVSQLSQTLMTETQLEQQQHAQRLALLDAFEASKTKQAAKANALREKENARHQKRLRDISGSGYTRQVGTAEQFANSLNNLEGKSRSDQVATVAGALGQMTAATSRENKAMFEINKAAGIASAIVDTYTGAQKAISQLGVFGIPVAAAITTAGFARVAAISSQSFNGGGGAAPTANAGAAAPPVTDTNKQSAAGAGKSLTIHIEGDRDGQGGRTVRELADQLNDLIGDGYQLGNINVT